MGCCLGLTPMIPLARRDLGTSLKTSSSRHSTGDRARFQLLVVAEVAGALALAVSASMLGAAAGKIQLVNLGYDGANLVSAHVRDLPGWRGAGYGTAPSPALIARRYDDLQRVRPIPGVAAATAACYPFLYALVRVDDPGAATRAWSSEPP